MRTLDRLMQLPPVFRLEDLLHLGLARETAHTSVMRWADRNLIVQAGPRAGVYFNLVRDRDGPVNRLLEAARKLYPSAVVIGPAVLHAHGWTTQRPHETDVAVLKMPTARQIKGLHFVMRAQAWYGQEAPHLLRAGEDSPFEIDSLPPERAVKDAKEHGDVWLPDADDLEIPDKGDGIVPIERSREHGRG